MSGAVGDGAVVLREAARGAVADRLLTVQEAPGPLRRSAYLAVKRSEGAAFAAADAAFEYRQHLMKF